MESRSASVKRMIWTGRVISGLVILFLLFDGSMKALRLDPAVETTVELGYPDRVVLWIGLALVVFTIIYAIPRTAIFGAILLTGFLGGAIATQVRVENLWFLFPLVLVVLVWTGLSLRDVRLRALFS
jgi:hypothetical protein